MKCKKRFSDCLAFFLLLFPVLSLAEETAPPNTVGGVLDPAVLGIDFKRKGDVPGTINVRIVKNRFEVWFLDKDGKIVEPDFDQGFIFFTNPNIKELRNLHTTLKRSDSRPMLTSPLIIQPPHRYLVRLVLTKEVSSGDIYQSSVSGQSSPEKIEEVYGQAVLNQLVQQGASAEEGAQGQSKSMKATIGGSNL